VQVDAVGAGIESDLSRTVDQNTRAALCGADGLNDARGQRLKLGEGEILFAHLDGIDTATRPLGGERNQRVALCSFIPRQQAAIRNGVEEHQNF
jgi:hypothetical protein